MGLEVWMQPRRCTKEGGCGEAVESTSMLGLKSEDGKTLVQLEVKRLGKVRVRSFHVVRGAWKRSRELD